MEESCEAEVALHAALMAEPRLAVSDAQIDAVSDEDARDNYRVVLRFRDRLLSAGTIEGAYPNSDRSWRGQAGETRTKKGAANLRSALHEPIQSGSKPHLSRA